MSTQTPRPPAEKRHAFKHRIAIVAGLFAACFLIVAARLFQLQILRHEQYEALTAAGREGRRLVPAPRAPITDRDGEVLAENRPFFDLAVRVDRLKLQRVTLDDARKERATELRPEERKARADVLVTGLAGDPFVVRLSRTLKREPLELARELFTALDNVARKPAWAAPATPQIIARGVDEDTWLALRSVHEDEFRNTPTLARKEKKEAIEREPPFPGLLCSVSTHRVYPKGSFACFVLGMMGELAEDDYRQLRRSGMLLENAEAHQRAWVALRDALNAEQAAALLPLLGEDPREIDDCARLIDRLAALDQARQNLAAQQGLAEALKWCARPPRMKLNQAEQLYLGVDLQLGVSHATLADASVGEGGAERYHNNLLRGKHTLKLSDREESSSEDVPEFLRQDTGSEAPALTLTLSSPWQEAAENALNAQEKRGAIIVMDIHDGSILALVSKPGFDPNVFTPPRSGAERQQQIKALLDDPEKPLLNRAICGEYPLGSIMKSLIAAVALEKGLLSPDETFECPGYIREGGQIFHCDGNHAHGTVNVYKGLRCSCNVMFHQVGARIGVENLGPFAKLIFGHRTGIDLPAESMGVYPDRAWRLKTYPTNPQARIWTRGNDFQLAIGQGQMNCTVIQAAVLMAAVANGGSVVTPHLRSGAETASKPLGVRDSILSIVRKGLDECVNVGTPGERGTCYTPFHASGELPVRVAGKTSTAEHRHGAMPHAWFAGYLPADHPKYAFVVMLEEAGHGGAVAGPVAYQMLREIYGTRQNPNPHPGERRTETAQR